MLTDSMVLSKHAQKLLGAYVMVMLVNQAWPFPDPATLATFNLLSQADLDWFQSNVGLVEEGSMSPVYIKYTIVSVDGNHYRVVYVNRGDCMEYCYTERVVGTHKTTVEWEKAE